MIFRRGNSQHYKTTELCLDEYLNFTNFLVFYFHTIASAFIMMKLFGLARLECMSLVFTSWNWYTTNFITQLIEWLESGSSEFMESFGGASDTNLSMLENGLVRLVSLTCIYTFARPSL